MLTDYPIIINSTETFKPDSVGKSRDVIETAFRTEAGTDEIIVTRTGKLTLSLQYSCSSTWEAVFQAWSEEDSLTVQIYDSVTAGYATYTMRMRNYKSNLIEGSHMLHSYNGAYTVSFDLIEF